MGWRFFFCSKNSGVTKRNWDFSKQNGGNAATNMALDHRSWRFFRIFDHSQIGIAAREVPSEMIVPEMLHVVTHAAVDSGGDL